MAKLLRVVTTTLFAGLIAVLPLQGQSNYADSLVHVIHTGSNKLEKMHAMVKLCEVIMPAYLDSAYQLISLASDLQYEKEGIEKADYLHALGLYHWYSGNYDTAIGYFISIAAMQETPEMLSRLARAYNNAGTLFNRLEQADSAYKFLHESLRIDSERGFASGQAKTHYDLSVMYYRRGKIELALRYQLESIKFNENIHDTLRLVNGYNVLGNIYSSLDEFEKASESYLKALELDKYFAGTDQHALLYNNLAALYCNMPGQFDEAIAFATSGIEEARKKNDFVLLSALHSNLGTAYRLINQSKKGLQELYLALDYLAQARNPRDVEGIYITIAETHFDLKNYDSARYYSIAALEIAMDNKTLSKESKALFLLSSADSATGNYRNALEYYQKAVLLRDSIWNLENKNRISELQIIYDTDKKTAENKFLIEQNELKASKIRNQRMLIFAVVVVILMISFMLVSEYRKKRAIIRKNEEILKKQSEINEQNLKLTELNLTKDKFFSIISHDLRSPLSTLVESLDLLVAEYDNLEDEEKFKMIKLLSQNSANTHNLLLNLLNWAQVQTGSLKNVPQRVDLFLIVREAIEILESRAAKKKQIIINEIPDFTFVNTDPKIIQSIFINLINNAIKFSNQGGLIRIAVSHSNSFIQVCVIDNGIGIPQDMIDSLFTLNKDVKRVGTNREAGTGLGLIMVKEFVKLIGGEIKVESKVGEGSKFCVSLPRHSG